MTNRLDHRDQPWFEFLDGLRGLAALYVVLHHASLEMTGTGLSRIAELLRGVLRHGHFAVAVFIVLSGYCLMRPLTTDPAAGLRGGLAGYLVRRLRRIVPPYYTVLVLCWAMIAFVPGLDRADGVRWDRALPASEPGVIVSHLLLFHNLHESWLFKIDPPLWSVATEWQIYLVFPLLLALWRRHGIALAVAVAFAAGGGVAALGGWLGNPALAKLCPWYAGLFALGMAAALDGRGRPQPIAEPRQRARIAVVVVVALIAVAMACLAVVGGADGRVMAIDLIVGAAAARLMVLCSRRSMTAGKLSRGRVLGLLESRGAVALGAFSYSLYLTHFPLLALCGRLVRGTGWGIEARYWTLLLAATVLCPVAAYGFHLVAERPWLAAAPRRSPAPRRAVT